jgi:hypothetical protein
MIARAITAKAAAPTMSLKPIMNPGVSSASSRNRLIASPGDEGRARAPGSCRTRSRRFRCRRAAPSNMKGPLVSWQPKPQAIRPAVKRTVNRHSHHSHPGRPRTSASGAVRLAGRRSKNAREISPGAIAITIRLLIASRLRTHVQRRKQTRRQRNQEEDGSPAGRTPPA